MVAEKTTRIDFHGHTCHSPDCDISLAQLRSVSLRKRVIPCITDHNTIEGAREYQRAYGKDSCIVGEEIKTSNGEIIGIFLKKGIPPGLSPEKTILLIKKQGGISILPHPFDRLRKSRLRGITPEKLRKIGIDAIEVFNSRTAFEKDNQLAVQMAEKHGFAMCAGSDWHTLGEFGQSFVELKLTGGITKNGILTALHSKRYKIAKKRSSMAVHILTALVKARKKILRGLPKWG